MAYNDDNREVIPSFGGDLGIIGTDQVAAEAIDDFLSTDPDEVEDTSKSTPPVKGKEKTPQPPKKFAKNANEEEETEDESEEGPSAQDEAEEFLNSDEKGKGKPKEKPEASGEGTEENEETEDENQFSILSKELFNLGIFTFGEDEAEEDIKIETPEDFRDRFELEKKKGAGEALEAFLARFGQPYAEMFESVFVNGVDPIEYLQSYSKITNLESVDLTQVDIQERIVREKLTTDGYEAEDVEKEIERLKNYNDLESRAKADHKVLLKREQQAKLQKEEDRKASLQREAVRKQQYTTSVRQIIGEKLSKKEYDGIPVDRPFAEEVNSYLTKERFKLQDGRLITEFDKELLDLNRPENYALKVKVAMLLKMVKKDPTLSKIQKRAVSKETSELFGKLRKDINNQKKVNKQNNTTESATEGKWF